MNHISRTRAAMTGAAVAAMAVVPAGSAMAAVSPHHVKTLKGVVVHENSSAHSFVIAERSGRLDAVHGHRMAVGEKVVVKARKLANGTFAAKREKVVAKRRARDVELEGVVTADPSGPEVVVSGSGSSIPVDTSAASGDPNPQVGEAVDTTAEVETDGQVNAQDVTDIGQSSAFRVEGKVLAVDDQARTLTISADDDGEGSASITVALPTSFDIAAYSVGDCVELTVTKAADGSLTAIQSFGDGNQTEANDRGGHGHDRGGPGGDRSDHHQEGDGEPQNGSADGGSGPSSSSPDGSTSSSSDSSDSSDSSGSGGTG